MSNSNNNLIVSGGKLFIAGDLTTSVLRAVKRGGSAGVTYENLERATPLDRKSMYVYINRLKKNGLVKVTPPTKKVKAVVITLKDSDMEFQKVKRIN